MLSDVNPAPPEDVKSVLERLADLQARMRSLEQSPPRSLSGLPSGVDAELARQMVESQNLRDTMKEFEQQQALVYENFIGGAGAFGTDIVNVLDKRLFPRLDAMFAGAKTGVAERMSGITQDDFALKTEAKLEDFEERFGASIEQFSILREDFERTEMKIITATDRMDNIWADQDTTGIGGWRLVMRAVSSFVDKGKEQIPDPLGRFRGPEDLREPSQPALANFFCPKCHSEEVRRLHRDTIFEEMLRAVFVAPYRCHECGVKFYKMRYSSNN